MGTRFAAFGPLVSRTPPPEQVSDLPNRERPRLLHHRPISASPGFSRTGTGVTEDRRSISLSEMAKQHSLLASRRRNYPARHYANSARNRQLSPPPYRIPPTGRRSP